MSSASVSTECHHWATWLCASLGLVGLTTAVGLSIPRLAAGVSLVSGVFYPLTSGVLPLVFLIRLSKKEGGLGVPQLACVCLLMLVCIAAMAIGIVGSVTLWWQ
jgi:hypothetical protein